MIIEQHGEFDFPKFNRERDRIKYYSKIYKNKSLNEAFADYYQDKRFLKMKIGDNANNFSFQSIELGSRLRIKFDNITKGKVNIISTNPKEYFTTKHNVWTWRNLDTDIWYDAEVVDRKNDGYMVDILKPMKDNYINSVKKTIKNYFQSAIVTVKNLQIQRGGYLGKINIDEISRVTGQPFEIDAFIPGSMIALNIEKDFEKWNGKSVEAMVINSTDNRGNLSVVCSRKKLLNSQGQTSLINLYDRFFRDGGKFDQVFKGNVTGIINSAKKQGVFVEIPEYSMTGLIPMTPDKLVNYRVGQSIDVKIEGVDWPEGREPYQRDWETGIIFECTLKPVLVEVNSINN